MSTLDLSGQVAFVTGAASGIGRATALTFAKGGAAVAVVDQDAAGSDETVAAIRSLGGRAHAVHLDLAELARITPAIESVLERFGRIDVLTNVAGIRDEDASLLDGTDEAWDRVFTVNLKAPWRLTRDVARHMIERGGGGRIVNVSSSSAFRGRRTTPAYACSKSALNQLTRSAAAELGPHGINVNAVAPGPTLTPMIGAVAPSLVTDGPLSNFLGRLSEAEDVANAIYFLTLPASRQITGQIIHTSAGAVL